MAVETLLTMTNKDTHLVHLKALDSMFKAHETVMEILMRVASFDFIYDNIRHYPSAAGRSEAYNAAFHRLPTSEQTVELKTKNYALNVLLRICQRVPDVASLNLASVRCPLLGEPFSAVLWRRLWDMHRHVLRIVARQSPATWWEDVDPIWYTICTLNALGSVVYRDPACLAQALDLVGVRRDQPDGAQPALNPLEMLATPWTIMAAAVLIHVDLFMQSYKQHGVPSHKHPMAVWLQPLANGGDYKQLFLKTIAGLRQTRELDDNIIQRLNSYFNECMGIQSPSMTPGVYPQYLG
ncbi:hypothetical protein PENTCL1PPCAC_9706 [Pristionchus entomophagus]|uniref:Uncharacterized protein n=1 Tax=Pristionchus entomophagus TaxID=358040 RepID=A0AAV5T759_9BILA|nr:hypothetical protein PENTCL1PPCAC_9706 [Pristionchus entomophagus]